MKSLWEQALSLAAGAVLLFAALVFPGPVRAQSTVATPAAIGDQLFFVYDATAPRTSFLNVANPSAAAVDLEVSFYLASGARLETRFLLGAWANRIINPGEIEGVAGSLGLAVVTPVDGPASTLPIVPDAPLAGSFTLANTNAGAGFGGNAVGRLAVDGAGNRAAPGTPVDGATVRYQRFAPPALAIPTYYDPRSLDPPEDDGNRVIVVTFEDSYEGRFDPVDPSGSLSWALYDSSGRSVARSDQQASLLLSTSLQDLAGNALLDSSGKVYFAYDAPQESPGNVFGMFLQSLQSFGAGERMPAVARFPSS